MWGSVAGARTHRRKAYSRKDEDGIASHSGASSLVGTGLGFHGLDPLHQALPCVLFLAEAGSQLSDVKRLREKAFTLVNPDKHRESLDGVEALVCTIFTGDSVRASLCELDVQP